MDEVLITVEITADDEYKLLPEIENILKTTIGVIHDIRLKTNEDELRMQQDTEKSEHPENAFGENSATTIPCPKNEENEKIIIKP